MVRGDTTDTVMRPSGPSTISAGSLSPVRFAHFSTGQPVRFALLLFSLLRRCPPHPTETYNYTTTELYTHDCILPCATPLRSFQLPRGEHDERANRGTPADAPASQRHSHQSAFAE